MQHVADREMEKLNKSVVPSLTLTSSQIARIEALAQQLDFKGPPSLQLDLLLDTIENQLQTTPQPTTLNQNQQLITEAIATIAQFSDNLNQTLTPLIQTLAITYLRRDKINCKKGDSLKIESLETICPLPCVYTITIQPDFIWIHLIKKNFLNHQYT